jgi:hypothetical protein
MNEQTKAVEVQQPQSMPETNFDLQMILTQAVEKQVPIETMEKLLAMRKELKAEWAKEQFDDAMSEFQGKCPVIKKTKVVRNKPEKGGGIRYRFAPIESIVEQVGPIISECGFSYKITSHQDAGRLMATVKVTHKNGHYEKSSFAVPVDSSGYMTAPQKVASAMTFAKRYAFCNAFGIMTGDADDDANDADTFPQNQNDPSTMAKPAPKPPAEPPKEPPATEAQMRKLHAVLAEYGMPREELKKHLKIESMTKLSKKKAGEIIDMLEKRIKDGLKYGQKDAQKAPESKKKPDEAEYQDDGPKPEYAPVEGEKKDDSSWTKEDQEKAIELAEAMGGEIVDPPVDNSVDKEPLSGPAKLMKQGMESVKKS